MTEPVIRVSDLGKRYVIGHEARHDTLRDTLAHGAKGMLRRLLRRAAARTTEEFWALRDVSFDVNQGDVVGIIGRNGAGKSTLLKILSRITEPTTGSVRLRGRVASLLEVGTGFHPELSGRENIHLNGAILGMSRAEIAGKFDEIVAFAEVERFLDTPVKHYSSGMYVRLAFAVAAHLEPEILIVDEVLAVGDSQFQQKCLGKMRHIARDSGRTVLFVSHSLAAVQQLCTRALLLQQGRLTSLGAPAEIVQTYLANSASYAAGPAAWQWLNRCEHLELLGVDAHNGGQPTRHIAGGQPLTLRLRYRCADPARYPDGLHFAFVIFGSGQRLINVWSLSALGRAVPTQREAVIECLIPHWPLRAMPVSVAVHISHRNQNLVNVEQILQLDSIDGDLHGHGIIPGPAESILTLPHAWKIDPV